MLRARALSVTLLAIALPAGSIHAQNTERYSIDGDAVAIHNIAGSVRIETGTGSNVVVDVAPGGRDGERLRVERMSVDGRPGLVVRYPAGDVVYRAGRWSGSTTVQVRGDGTLGGGFLQTRRVRVRGSGSGTEAHADLRILVPRGRTVFVRLGVGDVVASNVDGHLDIDVHSASVSTERTRGGLRIDTGSGRVRVRDAEGDLHIDTGSGSVEVAGVRGDAVNIDTGSGSVVANGVTGRSLRIDTGSGGIRATEVAARDIVLDTGSGRVDLDLTTDIDRLHIDTGSGGVNVTVPAGLGASLAVRTGSGGIAVDVPTMSVTSRARTRLAGTIGDGGGSIVIDTGSGGVRIRQR